MDPSIALCLTFIFFNLKITFRGYRRPITTAMEENHTWINISIADNSSNSNVYNNCYCGTPRIFEDSVLKNYKFYCDGILVSFFGIIGVIGNITSIIVLSRPNFSDTFHKLLISLAVFDTAYIIFGGINYTIRAFEVGSTNAPYQIAFVYVIHPFTSITK